MTLFSRSSSSKQGRRRNDDGVTGIEFELESIEFVRGTDDTGLLRIAGSWFAPANRLLDEVVLSVVLGPETLELTSLPDLSGVGRVASPAGEDWRAAFMMSAQVAEDPRAEFVLSAGEDGQIALPRPGEWEVAEPTQGEPETPPDPEPPAEPDPRAEPDLHTELDRIRAELATARRELEVERRRRAALAEELQTHISVEEDLRNAIATQEAELASAMEQASQTARAAERRRDVRPQRTGEDAHQPSRPADEDFLSRLERAQRASETAA